jgi:hypothetical protein
MTVAGLDSALQRAVLERVRKIVVESSSPASLLIGVRSAGELAWHGPVNTTVEGRTVHVEACPSVLAVLDAVARHGAGPDDVLVVLTDQAESALGDDLLARLHHERLYEASRHTLLDDLLGARHLDPQISRSHNDWLVDALIELALRDTLPSLHGGTLTLQRAQRMFAEDVVGLDPAAADLPELILAFDEPTVRSRWRALTTAQRSGLTRHLVSLLGRPAAVVTELAERRDDLLAELLVADPLTAASHSDPETAIAFGRFTQSRFGSAPPTVADLRTAAAAAVTAGHDGESARISQQLRRGDAMLGELAAGRLARYSSVLPSGLAERLAAAAAQLDETRLAAVEEHRDCRKQQHRLDRLRAALRLRRWVAGRPDVALASAGAGLRRHARELAWVDRALSQVRAGDPDPRLQDVLAAAADAAQRVRDDLDTAFAGHLARVTHTPPTPRLAVETVLPTVIAPLARQYPVLLIVIDGMSGAVAGELAAELAARRGGWTESVRESDGGREAVLAALPTETTYSRASLFAAALRAGTQADERAAFTAHSFWPRGGATLVHKAGVRGQDGSDLGTELEQALHPEHGSRVVAVVLNAVDDSLKQGRQSTDPSWSVSDVPGLPQLLERAVTSNRIVVLTSDHGHVLEHGGQYRHQAGGGGARWREATSPAGAEEVEVSGPRVLAPGGRAVLAATENLRYGNKAHGYHGGATLAEVAIPLVVLLPPGMEVLDGWYPHTLGEPAWWNGDQVAPAPPVAVPPRRRKPAPRQPEEDLFGAQPSPSRGQALLGSPTFTTLHSQLPSNRVPAAETFAAVVDALAEAGGRLPLGAVVQIAGSAGRNPRGFVTALGRVLNVDGFTVIGLTDDGRSVVLDLQLLDEQFPISPRP